MTKKEILLMELENLPEESVGKVLEYVKELKGEKRRSILPEEFKKVCQGAPSGWIGEFYGVMDTKMEDPVKWQKQIRDEWGD